MVRTMAIEDINRGYRDFHVSRRKPSENTDEKSVPFISVKFGPKGAKSGSKEAKKQSMNICKEKIVEFGYIREN